MRVRPHDSQFKAVDTQINTPPQGPAFSETFKSVPSRSFDSRLELSTLPKEIIAMADAELETLEALEKEAKEFDKVCVFFPPAHVFEFCTNCSLMSFLL